MAAAAQTLSLNMFHEAVGLLAADGTILAISTGCATLLGWTTEDCHALEAQPFTALFEEFSAGLASEILRTAQQEGRWHGEVFFAKQHHQPGDLLPEYLITTRLESPPPDSLAAFFFFALNYEEQHYAISDTMRKHAILQKLLRSAPMGILAAMGDGTLMQVNAEARELWETVGAELAPGMSLTAAFSTFAAPLQEAVAAALQGESGRISRQLLTPYGGPLVSLEWVCTRETILLFIEDRTLELRLEDQWRETERFASLGFMAANLAHEINNPLQSLRGILERLQRMHSAWPEAEAPPELGETTQRGLEVIERIAGIIHPVLDLARPQPPRIAAVDLPALVERTRAGLASHQAFRSITIALDPHGDLPAVETDAAQVQQILTNLLVNAAQEMQGRGTGTITIALDTAPEDWVQVRVQDDGPGVDPANAALLFTPFFTTKPPGQGTGLGLYASRAIAQKLGGWLELLPDAGPGACFLLTLPVRYTGPVPGAERGWNPMSGLRGLKM